MPLDALRRTMRTYLTAGRKWLTPGRLGTISAYLGHFLLSKGIAAVGPLLLAALLPATVYGGIELALSLGAWLSFLLGLAVSTALPQMTLRRNPIYATDVLALVGVAHGVLFTGTAVIALGLGTAPIIPLIAAMSFVVTAQSYLSIHFQTTSKRDAAAWTSSLSILTATLFGLLVWGIGAASLDSLALSLTLTAGVMTIAAGQIFATVRHPGLVDRLAQALRIARQFLIFGLVTTWIASSGRLILGWLFALETVAIYSFDFRLASLVLIMHQLLSIGAFASLYSMRTRQFDRLASIYLGAVALLLLAATLLFPWLLPHLALQAISPMRRGEAVAMFPAVALQVFGWLAAGAIEMRVNRARRVGRATVLIAFVAIATLALLLALRTFGGLDAIVAARVFALQQCAVALALIAALASRGLYLRRLTFVLVASAALLLAAGLVIGGGIR